MSNVLIQLRGLEIYWISIELSCLIYFLLRICLRVNHSETPFSFLLWFHRCEISKANISSCLFLVRPSSWKNSSFYCVSSSDFQISFFGRADCSHTNTKWLVRRLLNRTLSLTFFFNCHCKEQARKKEVSLKNSCSELGAQVLVISNAFIHADTDSCSVLFSILFC